MASKVATYAFTNKDDFENAKFKIRKELGDYSWDHGTTSDYYLLHILDECNDIKRAADICSGHGGKTY